MNPAKMRPSRVLSKLRAGKIASCTKLNLADPRASEIAAQSGVDSVWLDLEHVPNSIRDIEEQVRAAKIYDCDAIVRVERGSYSDLVRPLEMDAAGIIVPHVMNADEAAQIVRHTRFHPIGRRPIDGGNADGVYCGVPAADYIEQANRERFVILQIEDPEALDQVDEIAAVKGFDMLFFGPGDFSHALGIVGQIDHPDVQDGFRRVAEAAKRHGKFAATTSSIEALPRYVEMGYQFLSCGADVLMLSKGFGEVADAFDTIGSQS
ncbi:MAG TPA: aldolase [Candidatus Hydrogenedentes bacterium]|nr:aldolase [Candidatus Hydrogenedentota bacterium]